MLSEALCLLAIMKGCRCKVLQQYLEYLSSHYILFFFFFYLQFVLRVSAVLLLAKCRQD